MQKKCKVGGASPPESWELRPPNPLELGRFAPGPCEATSKMVVWAKYFAKYVPNVLQNIWPNIWQTFGQLSTKSCRAPWHAYAWHKCHGTARNCVELPSCSSKKSALSLKKSNKIESFEKNLKNQKPWIFND